MLCYHGALRLYGKIFSPAPVFRAGVRKPIIRGGGPYAGYPFAGRQVYAAKDDMERADSLIRAYLPFIKSEAAKCIGRPCTEQDDALSVAMIAFHEAIRGYSRTKGAFLKYAALVIRSRIIDFQRAEARHQGHVSMDTPQREDGAPLRETIAGDADDHETEASRDATRQEIAELSETMARYGLRLSDVAENCPKQQRTLAACRQAAGYAQAHPELLDEMLRTSKLPLAKLAAGAGVERKTLERHRKYLFALLLIYTNGFEIIRGHIRQVFGGNGGVRR